MPVNFYIFEKGANNVVPYYTILNVFEPLKMFSADAIIVAYSAQFVELFN